MKIKPLALVTFGFLLTQCQGQSPSSDDRAPPVDETIELPLQDPKARVVKIEQETLATLKQETVVPDTGGLLDVFKQQEMDPPAIDILIVIDNSYSMEEEQNNLAEKLEYLLADLHEVDWQINVITTDNACKRLPELPLTPETEDMANLFKRAVRAGISGSGDEMALSTSLQNLAGSCRSNEPWKRPNADLAVLIVSDEDETEISTFHENADLYIANMHELDFVAGVNFKTYGIIGYPEKPCESIYGMGFTYEEVVQKTKGIKGSICDASYGPTLTAISRDIRLNLKTDFPLTAKPVLPSVRLSLNGSAYDGDWTVVGKRLILADSLPEGSTLSVSYQTISFRLLELGEDSEGFVLSKVTLNGKELDPSLYDYDPTARTILLAFEPKPGDVIKTILKEKKDLPLVFSFPPVKTSHDVRCYVAEEERPASINYDEETIRFKPPLRDGETAYCLY